MQISHLSRRIWPLLLVEMICAPSYSLLESQTSLAKNRTTDHDVATLVQTVDPQVAMRNLLDGYIQRAPQDVEAFIHPEIRKNLTRMEFMRDRIQQMMTPEVHVDAIVSLRMVTDQMHGLDRVATFLVQLRTTPDFPGERGPGPDTRLYHWSLVQIRSHGRWYHYGGGF